MNRSITPLLSIPLTQIPRHPCRHPDNGRYEMPDYLVNCWSQLERDLTMATCLLQVHYDTPQPLGRCTLSRLGIKNHTHMKMPQ